MDDTLLGMSDEDFLKQPIPAEGEKAAEESQTTNQAESQEATTALKEEAEQTTIQMEEGSTGSTEAATTGSTESTDTSQTTTEAPEEQTQEQPKEGESEKTGEAEKVSTPDYEGFYKQIMAPFKANGKMIELQSPDEAIKLMQMGANYTRKMQELSSHRKVLLMLENNGLLDEGKLSFLIDLEKKNPDAIKKLIKEAGIDPLEIDTTAEPAYREGDHRVTDEEAAFQDALQEVQAAENGPETLRLIHNDWDQASKEELWKSPELMGIIHTQRQMGIYDRIAAEVNRQKVLGKISSRVPFLHAYKHVGDEMQKNNLFADLVQPQPSTTGQAPNQGTQATQPAVVATRVAAPKPAVANGDKVSAASPTKSGPTKVEKFVNPLEMSDEEFLKLANRV